MRLLLIRRPESTFGDNEVYSLTLQQVFPSLQHVKVKPLRVRFQNVDVANSVLLTEGIKRSYGDLFSLFILPTLEPHWTVNSPASPV
mgnify:CR=1 FL=1